MMPPLVAALLVACSERAGHRGSLELARTLLMSGRAAAAEQLLTELEASPWVGRKARFGRVIARALLGEPAELEPGPIDEVGPRAFAMQGILRAAFERGEFDAVLRLSDLAESVGRTPDLSVRLAARIEAGEAVDSSSAVLAALDSEIAAEPGSLQVAARVREHLRQPEIGTLLLDRTGRRLGYAVGGRLVPADGVDETLLPRNILDRVADHPEAGALHLTLDLELSQMARRSFGRFRGSIVLIDPVSGEVLAAVSDPRTYEREEGRAPFEQVREPASIAKLITTAASLRAGHDPDQELSHKRCTGHEVYAGQPLYCPVIAGPLRGLDRAMSVSCNVAFADLGVEVGRAGLLDELDRWGFGHRLGEFPGGRVLQPRGDDRQLADLSIGLQDSELTPLHAALLAATVAGHGLRPEPTLVAAVDGKLGLHPRALPVPPPIRVLEPGWANQLEQAMERVVERGTAMRVRTPGFPVAMKTGTASDPRWGFHVNYVGYGPLPEARVAFAVRITNQGTSKQVRYAAVEVTSRLLRGLRAASLGRDWQEAPPSLDQRLAGVRVDPRSNRWAEAAASGRIGR